MLEELSYKETCSRFYLKKNVQKADLALSKLISSKIYLLCSISHVVLEGLRDIYVLASFEGYIKWITMIFGVHAKLDTTLAVAYSMKRMNSYFKLTCQHIKIFFHEIKNYTCKLLFLAAFCKENILGKHYF